jgi:fructokinase
MDHVERLRFDVVTIGEALLDFIATDAQNLIGATQFIRAPGGAPANVAVAAARLGAASAIVGAVGADPFGDVLAGVLEAESVDVSALRRVPERTTLAYVARSLGGIPDFVFYRGSDATLRPADIPTDLIAQAGFVHVSSMALLTEPSRSATSEAVTVAKEHGALVSVDPNLRPASWPSLEAARQSLAPLLRDADVLKMNEEEARLLADTANLHDACDHLVAPNRLLVVTRGEAGAHWRWQGRAGDVASPPVEVVDTIGAGDAFVGALLADLARHLYTSPRFHTMSVNDLEKSLRFACAAGALTCTKPGAMASLPTRDQVERILIDAR